MNFHERKKWRTEYYFKYVHKRKLITCTACNGTGYYDYSRNGVTPKCGACEGKGKVRS